MALITNVREKGIGMRNFEVEQYVMCGLKIGSPSFAIHTNL
jgi:hypothetical protein